MEDIQELMKPANGYSKEEVALFLLGRSLGIDRCDLYQRQYPSFRNAIDHHLNKKKELFLKQVELTEALAGRLDEVVTYEAMLDAGIPVNAATGITADSEFKDTIGGLLESLPEYPKVLVQILEHLVSAGE